MMEEVVEEEQDLLPMEVEHYLYSVQDLLGHLEEVEHHNNLDTEVEEDMQEVQPALWPSLYFQYYWGLYLEDLHVGRHWKMTAVANSEAHLEASFEAVQQEEYSEVVDQAEVVPVQDKVPHMVEVASYLEGLYQVEEVLALGVQDKCPPVDDKLHHTYWVLVEAVHKDCKVEVEQVEPMELEQALCSLLTLNFQLVVLKETAVKNNLLQRVLIQDTTPGLGFGHLQENQPVVACLRL